MASTATLASDLPASTRLSGPSNRFNPALGLTREKSMRNARPLRRNRVCTSTTATPATIEASTNGAAPSQQTRPAKRASDTSGRSSCARARKMLSRSARSCTTPGPVMTSANVTAASPAKLVSSRETGAWPSSRAFCCRRAVAASVRSSCCDSPAMAGHRPGRLAKPARTEICQAVSREVASMASKAMPPRICAGITTK